MPPNGRSLRRALRKIRSMISIKFGVTIDTSSTTRTSSSLITGIICTRGPICACGLETSSGLTTRGGIPKKEWIVLPPTLMAAIPVGATTAHFEIRDWRNRISVVFPVPARPVTKIAGAFALIASSTNSYSGNTSIFSSGSLAGSGAEADRPALTGASSRSTAEKSTGCPPPPPSNRLASFANFSEINGKLQVPRHEVIHDQNTAGYGSPCAKALRCSLPSCESNRSSHTPAPKHRETPSVQNAQSDLNGSKRVKNDRLAALFGLYWV